MSCTKHNSQKLDDFIGGWMSIKNKISFSFCFDENSLTTRFETFVIDMNKVTEKRMLNLMKT